MFESDLSTFEVVELSYSVVSLEDVLLQVEVSINASDEAFTWSQSSCELNSILLPIIRSNLTV